MTDCSLRNPFWTVARVAIATLIPLSLTAGLLTFPTNCTCGADISHGHALFTLVDHWHDERAVAGAGFLDVEPADANVAAIASSTDGPDVSQSALLPTIPILPRIPCLTCSYAGPAVKAGIAQVVEQPPPQ